MRERPIPFTGPMIRAVLKGHKCQTRRVIAGVPPRAALVSCVGGVATFQIDAGEHRAVCRYGEAGDRLWVREQWRTEAGGGPRPNGFRYRADDAFEAAPVSPSSPELWREYHREDRRWRAARFMPRFASRLLLEVLEVRAERLGAITAADALAEGLGQISKDQGRTWKYGIADRDGLPGIDNEGWPWQEWCTDPRDAYMRLWNRINGERPGCAVRDNPWVFVVTFARV